MNTKKSKKSKISGKELAWYVISLSIIVIGLSFIVFHFVGDILRATGAQKDKNAVVVSAKWWDSWSKFGPNSWLYWGLIVFAFGILILVSSLIYNAKKTDRDYDKEQRRLQRLESITEADVLPAIQENKKEENAQ